MRDHVLFCVAHGYLNSNTNAYSCFIQTETNMYLCRQTLYIAKTQNVMQIIYRQSLKMSNPPKHLLHQCFQIFQCATDLSYFPILAKYASIEPSSYMMVYQTTSYSKRTLRWCNIFVTIWSKYFLTNMHFECHEYDVFWLTRLIT